MLLISETCVNIFGEICFKVLASVLEKMLTSYVFEVFEMFLTLRLLLLLLFCSNLYSIKNCFETFHSGIDIMSLFAK